MILSATVYLVNRFGLKAISDNFFVHNYASDLFAMPFILAYSNLLIGACSKPEWVLTTFHRVAAFTFFCAICWECIAPRVIANSVGDPFDVFVYAIGALGYLVACRWFGIRPKTSSATDVDPMSK